MAELPLRSAITMAKPWRFGREAQADRTITAQIAGGRLSAFHCPKHQDPLSAFRTGEFAFASPLSSARIFPCSSAKNDRRVGSCCLGIIVISKVSFSLWARNFTV